MERPVDSHRPFVGLRRVVCHGCAREHLYVLVHVAREVDTVWIRLEKAAVGPASAEQTQRIESQGKMDTVDAVAGAHEVVCGALELQAHEQDLEVDEWIQAVLCEVLGALLNEQLLNLGERAYSWLVGALVERESSAVVDGQVEPHPVIDRGDDGDVHSFLEGVRSSRGFQLLKLRRKVIAHLPIEPGLVSVRLADRRAEPLGVCRAQPSIGHLFGRIPVTAAVAVEYPCPRRHAVGLGRYHFLDASP
eukprot:1344575-Amorphochlora_amoeboformis.AAC.1